jgi:hypothetical protein
MGARRITQAVKSCPLSSKLAARSTLRQLTLVVSVPDAFEFVQIQRHSHLRVDQHWERRAGGKVLQIAGLTEPVDIRWDLEQFWGEGRRG